jgi:hypothetical protein
MAHYYYYRHRHRDSSWTPGAFYIRFYNHSHRLRLKKKNCIWSFLEAPTDLFFGNTDFFLALLDPGPGGDFTSETAVKPPHGDFRSETAVAWPVRK